VARDNVVDCVCKERHKKARKQQQQNYGHQTKLPTIDPPPKVASSSEYGWSFMPTTSHNMGLLHGIPSVTCEGGHLVLTVQIDPHLTTLSNPSLGASNGAQITSPISVQTNNISKVQWVSKKIVELEM
jgi:hypothetical protein